MEPSAPPPPLPTITEIRKHYQTMERNLEHHHAQIAAVQEKLISSQSQKIHTYEQKIQTQDQNIEGLRREVERLRGVLTNLHVVDTVSPLNTKKSAGISHTEYNTTCSAGYNKSPGQRTESFSRPGSQGGPRPLQINKELPPRPVSDAPSINISRIIDPDSLVTELHSSRTTPTSMQQRISAPQALSPTFYNPYSPQSTFPPHIKSVTDPLLSPRSHFPARSQAASRPPAPCHVVGSKADPNPPPSPHKPALLPLHEAFILPNVPLHLSPGLIAAYEGNLPPRLLTPDEFFRRSGLPLPCLPKNVSLRLRKSSRSRAGSKEIIVIEEESDEVIRARIREEAGKRKRAVFGDVERVAKNSIIHSTVTTEGPSPTETVRSRRLGKEKGAMMSLTVFPIGGCVKKESEEKNSDAVQKTSITNSSSTRTPSVGGTPGIEDVKSKFKEGDEIGTGADFERIIGLMDVYEHREATVVVGSPSLEVLGQVLSEGKQTDPGLRDTVRKKLTDVGRYLALGG